MQMPAGAILTDIYIDHGICEKSANDQLVDCVASKDRA